MDSGTDSQDTERLIVVPRLQQSSENRSNTPRKCVYMRVFMGWNCLTAYAIEGGGLPSSILLP